MCLQEELESADNVGSFVQRHIHHFVECFVRFLRDTDFVDLRTNQFRFADRTEVGPGVRQLRILQQEPPGFPGRIHIGFPEFRLMFQWNIIQRRGLCDRQSQLVASAHQACVKQSMIIPLLQQDFFQGIQQLFRVRRFAGPAADLVNFCG